MKALINNEILQWVRTEFHSDIPAFCANLGINPDKYEKWEQGIEKPSLGAFRSLCDKMRLPISLFYLSAPPQKKNVKLRFDLRTLFGEEFDFSLKLRKEIKWALDRRSFLIDYSEHIPNWKDYFQGKSIREGLDISFDEQIKLKANVDFFAVCRTNLFDRGILVFQAAGYELEEFRGICIHDEILPVIIINRKDSNTGKVFTLFHELAHLQRNQSNFLRNSEDSEEVECNRIAADSLVPEADFVELVKKFNSDDYSTIAIIVAKKFKVSREFIFRRLFDSGFIGKIRYDSEIETLKSSYTKAAKGFVPPNIDCISKNGPSYVKFIINQYSKQKITTYSAIEFLGISHKTFSKILGGKS